MCVYKSSSLRYVDDVVCTANLPVNCIRRGIRCLRLHGEDMPVKKFDHSYVLVAVDLLEPPFADDTNDTSFIHDI